MSQSLSVLTQTKYYTPALNAAIFDGPLRLYFAQYQEASALEIYFRLRERLNKDKTIPRKKVKGEGKNVFVMLYPNEEVFTLSFDAEESQSGQLAMNRIGDDYVFGINGSLESGDYSLLCEQIESVLIPADC